MILTYNGVDLQIEQVQSFEQNAIYSADGVDYLYTHVRISVRAIWHPNATTSSGKVAAEAIDTLRRTLMTPRGRLLIKIPSGGAGGSKTILRSPLKKSDNVTYYPEDANHGPKPIGMPVIQLIGEKLAIVDFAVETWVKECDYVYSSLISHRWEMQQQRDAEFFVTRTTTGTAIFRTDKLSSDSRTPDNYRHFLLPPIPDGFRRINTLTAPSSDGTTLNYSVVDEQVRGDISPSYNKIARYEGTGIFKYRANINLRAIAQGAARGAEHTETGVVGAVAGAVDAIAEGLPRVHDGMVFRLWGRPQATQKDLLEAAAAILSRNNVLPRIENGRPVITVFNAIQSATVALTGLDVSISYSMGPRPLIEVSIVRTYPDNGSGFVEYFKSFRNGSVLTMYPVVLQPTSEPSVFPLQSTVQIPGVPCVTPDSPTNTAASFRDPYEP